MGSTHSGGLTALPPFGTAVRDAFSCSTAAKPLRGPRKTAWGTGRSAHSAAGASAEAAWGGLRPKAPTPRLSPHSTKPLRQPERLSTPCAPRVDAHPPNPSPLHGCWPSGRSQSERWGCAVCEAPQQAPAASPGYAPAARAKFQAPHALRPGILLPQASKMTVRQCGPTRFSCQPGCGGGAAAVLHAAAAAPSFPAPCGFSLGLPLPACPTVRCMAAEDMPGTPSERSRAGADRASPPPPVDTPSIRFERRSPTSRFDALFLAAQQELGEWQGLERVRCADHCGQCCHSLLPAEAAAAAPSSSAPSVRTGAKLPNPPTAHLLPRRICAPHLRPFYPDR